MLVHAQYRRVAELIQCDAQAITTEGAEVGQVAALHPDGFIHWNDFQRMFADLLAGHGAGQQGGKWRITQHADAYRLASAGALCRRPFHELGKVVEEGRAQLVSQFTRLFLGTRRGCGQQGEASGCGQARQ